jgi:hypothetical protein
VSESRAFDFFSLPPDIKRSHIYSHVRTDKLGLFALTCKTAYEDVRTFAHDVLLSRALRRAAYATSATNYAVGNSELSALNILKLYPELLFEEGYVKDPVGRYFYTSVYKFLLGAGDIFALKSVHEKIIPRIENGELIARQQFAGQFPVKGSKYDARNIVQIAQVAEDLDALAVAITNDPCTDLEATTQITLDVLYLLGEHLRPQKNEIITSGLHMPPEILQKITETYNQHYINWSHEQRAFYLCEMLGLIEKLATAVDEQRFVKGLRNYNNEKAYPDRVRGYLAKGVDPNSLGRKYYIDPAIGVVRQRGAKPEVPLWVEAPAFVRAAINLRESIDAGLDAVAKRFEKAPQIEQSSKSHRFG